jgi:hypothetical protein
MIKTPEEAIKVAAEYLAETSKDRLRIVDKIEGVTYNLPEVDLSRCWIIYVEPEEVTMLDGCSKYLIVEPETGKVFPVSVISGG